MPNVVHTKEAVRAQAESLLQAAEFFQTLARRSELPLTPDEFDARVKAFYEQLDEKLALSNAIVMAVLRDEPMPQSVYSPWASSSMLWQWRAASEHPLPFSVFNGKVMIKPSDFFAALKHHGKASA